MNEPTPPKVTPRTDAALVIMNMLCFVIFGSDPWLQSLLFAAGGGLFGVAIWYAVAFACYRLKLRAYRKSLEPQQ